MKKLVLAASLLVFLGTVSATTIAEEEVRIELSDPSIDVEFQVKQLTSTDFTYVTNYPVFNLEGTLNGEPVNCKVERLTIGSNIRCDVNMTRSFNVTLRFETDGLTSSVQDVRVFRYSESIYRPTNNYTLKVVLPKGGVIVNEENITQPAISPAGMTGSDGQQIFVKWETDPSLGETLSYQFYYEQVSNGRNYLRAVYGVLLALALAGGSYLLYSRLFREDLEDLYSELSGDEKEVLEILIENDGEMLQKDVVNESGYSKAKVSGIVSSLVEKDIVAKQKEGRSNKLAISKRYRF